MTTETPAASRSLRIAVVTETYPPEINGVATTIARVVEGLRHRGHSLQLVRPRRDRTDRAQPSDGLQETLVAGLPIPNYPQLRMGLPATRALASQWRKAPPDVVHIATEGPLGWSALRAAIQLRLPVTSDFRTNFHAYSRHYGFGWLERPIAGYLRRFHNRTCFTMVPTETLRSTLRSEGFERLVVVARGVDTQLFSPARRSESLRRAWGVAPHENVVICVGRLAPEKNLDTLLEAYHAMRATGRVHRLVFVGDGPAAAELRAGCPDAVFAGLRRGEDLASHYASGDLFLFPSLTETFGNVTPEAMASGLPVLAFDYAAAAELITSGENGLLAPFADRASFVRQAVALTADPSVAQRLGTAARHAALALDWTFIVRQIEGVFGAAMAGESAPAAAAPAVEACRV